MCASLLYCSYVYLSNIMQEWMEGWFKKNGIEFALNDNIQMPPER